MVVGTVMYFFWFVFGWVSSVSAQHVARSRECECRNQRRVWRGYGRLVEPAEWRCLAYGAVWRGMLCSSDTDCGYVLLNTIERDGQR